MTYNDAVSLSSSLGAHKSFSLCKTKVPGRRYLKLKGVDKDAIGKLFDAIEAEIGANRSFSYNPARQTACITFYHPMECICDDCIQEVIDRVL